MNQGESPGGRPTSLILLAVGCVLALVAGIAFMVVRLTSMPEAPEDTDRMASSDRSSRADDDPAFNERTDTAKNEPVAIPHPCDVVPAKAVAAILPNAAPLPIPLDNKEGVPPRCEWVDLVDVTPVAKRYVIVEFIDSEHGMAEWRKANDRAEDVPGLGAHAYSFSFATEAAFGVYEPEAGSTVYFAHGDLVARVTVGGWDRKNDAAVAIDAGSVLSSAVQLAKEIASTAKPKGPFERPYLGQDTFAGKGFGKAGCTRIPTGLATRLMGKKPEAQQTVGDQSCVLRSLFERPGPNRERHRSLTIELDESDSSGTAALEFRRSMLTSTKQFMDITEIRALPDTGDEAYLLVGRMAESFNGTRPGQTLARVLIRRADQVLMIEFSGSDFPPGADSFLRNPEYEPIPVQEVSKAAMDLTTAYLGAR